MRPAFVEVTEVSQQYYHCPTCEAPVTAFMAACKACKAKLPPPAQLRPLSGPPPEVVERYAAVAKGRQTYPGELWEYKRIQASSSTIKELDAKLTQLGLEGWELVTSAHTISTLSYQDQYMHLWFKRRIIQ